MNLIRGLLNMDHCVGRVAVFVTSLRLDGPCGKPPVRRGSKWRSLPGTVLLVCSTVQYTPLVNSRGLKMDVGGLPPAAALLKTEGFATWLLLLLVVLVAQLIAEHLSRRLELVFGGALGGDSARPVFGTAPSSPSSPLPKVTYSRAPRRRTAPDFGGSTAPLSQPYTCTHLARGGAAEPSNAMAEDEPQVLKSSAKSHKPVVATANGDMGVDTAVLGPPSGDVDDSDDDADLAELKRVWLLTAAETNELRAIWKVPMPTPSPNQPMKRKWSAHAC